MPEILRLRQSSMQFGDIATAVAEDARGAIPDVGRARNAPDFIGFTEAGGRVGRIIKARCVEAGYGLVTASSVAIAVHPRHRVLERGSVSVLPGLVSPSGKGSHTARPILEVTVETRAGNVVTVHEAHWVTDGSDRREDKQDQQTDAMCERVNLHGRGRRIALWMGDTNIDEQPGEGQAARLARFTRRGLVSVYDELEKYPRTMGRRTIDVIGSLVVDKRVYAKSVVTGKARNSNHLLVDAVYVIE